MATTKKTTSKTTKAATEEVTTGQAAALKEVDARDAELEAMKQQNAMLMEQMEEMRRQMAELTRPQVVQVQADVEKVLFLWQAEVADENVQAFGDRGMFGRIVGKTGSFYVPKADLSKLLDDRVRYFLDQRWLIVVSGLTDEEREALGVDYREGELLDKRAFRKLLELGDGIFDLYPMLCEGHKKMVVQRYAEGYAEGSGWVTRERVTKLNELSKAEHGGKGDFVSILERMNAADVSE